jgi:hypothetical protein
VKTIAYASVFIALACVLGTRRIGGGNWQYWAVFGLVTAAVEIGRVM